MLERRHIEMMNDEMVAQNLTEAFDKYCSRQGPSVLREEYEKVVQRPAVWLLGAAVRSPLKPLAGALLPGKVQSRLALGGRSPPVGKLSEGMVRSLRLGASSLLFAGVVVALTVSLLYRQAPGPTLASSERTTIAAIPRSA